MREKEIDRQSKGVILWGIFDITASVKCFCTFTMIHMIPKSTTS